MARSCFHSVMFFTYIYIYNIYIYLFMFLGEDKYNTYNTCFLERSICLTLERHVFLQLTRVTLASNLSWHTLG